MSWKTGTDQVSQAQRRPEGESKRVAWGRCPLVRDGRGQREDSVCGMGDARTRACPAAPEQASRCARAALSSSGLEMLKKAICTLRR